MGVIKDLTNKRFGRLTAIKLIGRSASRHMLWECICDCGNTKTVSSNSLSRKMTQSCGCLATELTKKNNVILKRRHGLGTSRVYNIWAQMKQRCDNPHNKNYEHYGLRGIGYCDKWETFEGFWEDMEQGYSDELTLDRKDNSKGYSKDNCRWATVAEQANNKTTNRHVTVDGIQDTIANTARRYGISPELAYWRLKNGQRVEEAFLRPAR